jgi:hypothetical protein
MELEPYFIPHKKLPGWMQWLKPVIPVAQVAQIQEHQGSRPARAKSSQDLISTNS